jgi:hypothetical protein
MSTATMPASSRSSSQGHSCSRCGAELAGRYCQACGTEIYGPRLDRRGAPARMWSAIGWHLSRFGATLLDLTVRPAQVAWVYLSGHRDRYLHPLPYLVFALIAERLAYGGLKALSALLDRPGAALLISSEFWYRLPQVVAVLVVAVIWRVLFRRTGFNFFEMTAIAIYAYAQFVVLWTVFALVVGVLPIQSLSLVRWGGILQALLGLAVAFHTGWKVFRENPLLVAFKLLVAAAIPFEVLAALDSILRHG